MAEAVMIDAHVCISVFVIPLRNSKIIIIKNNCENKIMRKMYERMHNK